MSEHQLRKPCANCSGRSARIETKNGQDCLYCTGCGRWQYNAPKTETGRAARSTQTTHESIKPKLRAQVLMRANAHCELCGKSGCDLHVGHLISVKSGMDNGLTDAQINDLENLCAMCSECNLGLGAEPVTLRFCISLLINRMNFREATNANQS